VAIHFLDLVFHNLMVLSFDPDARIFLTIGFHRILNTFSVCPFKVATQYSDSTLMIVIFPFSSAEASYILKS